MLCRKFKKVSAILMGIVYFVLSSVFNLSFAILDTNASLDGKVFYIRNQDNGLYMKDLDYFSMVLSQYSANSQQQWELIYISDGYYAIRNNYTGKYLTAPANNYEGSLITQETVRNSSYTERQEWSFTPAYYGATTYIIQAKSQEDSDLVLMCSDSMGMYGYDLIQGYIENFDYRGEWILDKVDTVTLVGITDTVHNHTSALEYSKICFIDAGSFVNLINTSSMSVANIKLHMENSDVFILFTHGDWNTSNSYAHLNQTGTVKLNSSDIYNYSSHSSINMNDCEVAVFAGCYTSYNTSYNLPLASVHAGASYAVGFNSYVNCEDLSEWTNMFSYLYTNNYNPALAAETAADSYGLLDTIDIISPAS